MRLVSFHARGVHGHMGLDLSFKPDLNLLIGVNGSGKTTTLRLIHALLSPSLEDLYLIPFSTVTISLVDSRREEKKVTATKSVNALSISVSGIPQALDLPALDPAEATHLFRQSNRAGTVAEFVATHCVRSKVWTFLKSLSPPLFLGLDRRGGFEESEEELMDHALYRDSNARMRNMAVHSSPRDGLAEVQALLSNEYRRLRAIQDGYVRKLRKAVIISSFKFAELTPGDIESSRGDILHRQRQQLVERKSEIRSALQNIDAESADVLKEVDKFFRQLDKLYSQMEEAGRDGATPGFHIEWLMNKAQIARITTLLEVIDEHRASVDKLFTPTTKFLSTINAFYTDSRKRVALNEVGQLTVERADKEPVGITSLSSGERQILVMFGQLYFRRDRNVFIIDEPELSLHVRWQKSFVDKALDAQRSAQLILATHSPEIVGEYKDRCINVKARL